MTGDKRVSDLEIPIEELIVEDPDTQYTLESDKLLVTKEDMVPEIIKFWKRRYMLFYKMDHGIRLTKELWYSVTPEEIALYITKFIKHCLPESTKVLDMFSGGGGNAAHFTKDFEKVYCVDFNLVNLQCCYHNTGVYGKSRQKRLAMFQADWSFAMEDHRDRTDDSGNGLPDEHAYHHTQQVRKYLESQSIDVIFSSPPWGGVTYIGTNGEFFDLDRLAPLPLDKLLESLLTISPNIAIFLPKNCDVNQINEITERVYKKKTRIRISNMHINGFLKGIVVFWGDAFSDYKRPSVEDYAAEEYGGWN